MECERGVLRAKRKRERVSAKPIERHQEVAERSLWAAQPHEGARDPAVDIYCFISAVAIRKLLRRLTTAVAAMNIAACAVVKIHITHSVINAVLLLNQTNMFFHQSNYLVFIHHPMSGKCLGLQMRKERFHTSIIQAVPFNASFIIDLHPNASNIVELATCVCARWKIENETFNVLKNKSYHLEHNFGYGKQTLSSVLVALNLIAFSLHAACDACEPDWQKAREICGVRNRIFNILWSLTAYLGFPTWRAFLKMVATSRPPPP